MSSKQNVNEPLPASDLFGVLRDFLAQHGADEIQWDAIDRLQEQHEASRLSLCCNSPLVNEGGAVRCMNCTAEVTPNASDQATASEDHSDHDR